MNNSIKDNITKEDIISEIDLIYNSDKNNTCIVVEGQTDNCLLKSFISKNTHIFESYSGKDGVVDIISKFKKCKRVIGIIDKDYLPKLPSKRIFCYDFSCLEMMVISNDSCNERLHSIFCKSKLNAHELREKCLCLLEPLSMIRKLNFLNNWNISISKIKPGKFYSENITDITSNIINEINKFNGNNGLTQDRIERYKRFQKPKTFEEYLNITNGHDFTNLYYNMCFCTKKGISEASFEKALYSTFGPYEFKGTKLFLDLKHYQKKFNLSFIKI